jgi:glycosyltransferase involved in cell wall biosynthesis
MKVALFSNSYLPYLSGITLSIKTLKDELRHLGHTAYVVGPWYPGLVKTDPKVLRLPSLPATYPGYRFVFPYSPGVFSALKKEQIELIHAHQPFGVGLAALSLARRMKIPFVYSFHTLFSRYVHHAPVIPQRLAKWAVAAYLSFFCRQADTIIVPSEMVRRLLVSRKVRKPIEVIPTGIKLRKIKQRKEAGNHRSNIRKKHQIPPEARILLYSGRLSEEKNVPFLLEAFSFIRQQEANLYFILVGGGPKEKEYRARAKEDRVIFTGQIPHAEVLDYYLASDLFIYASITETQGLVLTEAKACRLPVVALFGGGISDVIESGIDGYIVRRDQKAFVEHVLRLLKDDNLRRHMALKAEEDAHNRFSSVAVAKKVESVYNSLITKRGES